MPRADKRSSQLVALFCCGLGILVVRRCCAHGSKRGCVAPDTRHHATSFQDCLGQPVQRATPPLLALPRTGSAAVSRADKRAAPSSVHQIMPLPSFRLFPVTVPFAFDSQGGLHPNWRIMYKLWAERWATFGKGRGEQEQGLVVSRWVGRASVAIQRAQWRLVRRTRDTDGAARIHRGRRASRVDQPGPGRPQHHGHQLSVNLAALGRALGGWRAADGTRKVPLDYNLYTLLSAFWPLPAALRLAPLLGCE